MLRKQTSLACSLSWGESIQYVTLNMMLAIRLKKTPSIPSLRGFFFYHEWVFFFIMNEFYHEWILLLAFTASEMIVYGFSLFCQWRNYIDSVLNDTSLHSWDKTLVILIYYSFRILLDSIWYYFVNIFFSYVCEKFWFIIFL